MKINFNGMVRILSESFALKKGYVDNGIFKEATDPSQVKGVRLVGKAITPDQPTRNKVSYSKESLMATFQSLIGKPFLDSHKDDSIRTHPPFGHVVNARMTEEGLMYEVDIDPEETTFIRKVERGDIKGVSIQVLVSDVEQKEGFVRAHVQEFLELSSVLIPGDGDTSMKLTEAFKMNKKEDVDVKPLNLDMMASGETPATASKPKIAKPAYNQVLDKWEVKYEGEILKFDNEASANAFYNSMTKFQDSSETDKAEPSKVKTEPMVDGELKGLARGLESVYRWQFPDKGTVTVHALDEKDAMKKIAQELGKEPTSGSLVKVGENISDLLECEKESFKEAEGGDGVKRIAPKGAGGVGEPNPRPVVNHDTKDEYDNLKKIPSKPQDRRQGDYPVRGRDKNETGFTQGCPWCGSKNYTQMEIEEVEEAIEEYIEGDTFYYCHNCGTIFEVQNGKMHDHGKPELRAQSDEKPYLDYNKEGYGTYTDKNGNRIAVGDEVMIIGPGNSHTGKKYRIRKLMGDDVEMADGTLTSQGNVVRVMNEHFTLKAECLDCGFKSHIDNFPDEGGILFCTECQGDNIQTIKEKKK